MSEISESLGTARGWLNAATYAKNVLRKAKLLQASYAYCLQVLMEYPCKLNLEVEESEIRYKAYSILATSKSHEEIAPWAWDCICVIEDTLKPCYIEDKTIASALLDVGKVLLVQNDLLPKLIRYCGAMVKISDGTYFDKVKKSLDV